MARKKAEKAVEEQVPQGPRPLKFGAPAGTVEFVTFKITAAESDRGMLQASPMGYIEKDWARMQDEEKLRSMTEEEIEAAITLAKEERKVTMLPSEIAEKLTYPTKDGRYFHPAAAFLSAIIDAFWATKAAFVGIKEGANNIVARTVKNVSDQAILFDPKTMKPFKQPTNGKKPPYGMHICTGLNRIAGRRIVLYRPHWRTWGTFVSFRFNTGMITPRVIQQGLEIAGQQVGVGAFRLLPPQNVDIKLRGRGGPFGGWSKVEMWDKPVPEELQPLL